MAINKLCLLLVVSWLMGTAIAVRELPMKPGHNLAARLESGGGLVECWTALLELRSCTNEIVLFFLNGEAYLGLGCCRAIRIITRQCWPAMFTSLGFTAQEGDILRGYCDAFPGPPPFVAVPPPAESPVKSPA
ncbi:hypothetical protein HHK36_004170 [Tetracentron sinense]|uniref:Prolamin-like domain-containing protein n=1 Tax=Tetracentron sinense TaxID=13715 RepID=A0A835DP85_TETSI|nr:hypothetical protein HHK36_004170 [Tetracentron sinense]